MVSTLGVCIRTSIIILPYYRLDVLREKVKQHVLNENEQGYKECKLKFDYFGKIWTAHCERSL